MTAWNAFQRHFAACPLIAILRGIAADDVVAIGEALVDAGIRIIEVPLNSPDPLTSIRMLVEALGEGALVGAGTVLNAADVAMVAQAGGRIIVSPSTNPAVITATVQRGLVSAPGYFTPSEAFTALDAGAQVLKLFPAEAASPIVVRAQRAVLPRGVPLVVVGGIKPETMADYRAAGADGFGLGSALYSPGRSARDVAAQAARFVAALG